MERISKARRFHPLSESKLAMIETDRRSFNEALIYLVEKTPAIWDTTRTDYKNSKRIGLVWEDIAKTLNTTAHHVAYRWRNLRDTFRKQLRKMEEGKEYVRWSYFEQLKFLTLPMQGRGIIEGRADVTTDARDDTESADNEQILDESHFSIKGEVVIEDSTSVEMNEEPSLPYDVKRDLLALTEQSFDGESPRGSVSYDVEPDSSTLRRRQSNFDLDYCILQQLHQTSLLLAKNESAMKAVGSQLTKKKPDPIEHFLLSLVPGLKETPPELLPSLQMHIIYLISKYKQGIVPTDLPNIL